MEFVFKKSTAQSSKVLFPNCLIKLIVLETATISKIPFPSFKCIESNFRCYWNRNNWELFAYENMEMDASLTFDQGMIPAAGLGIEMQWEVQIHLKNKRSEFKINPFVKPMLEDLYFSFFSRLDTST